MKKTIVVVLLLLVIIGVVAAVVRYGKRQDPAKSNKDKGKTVRIESPQRGELVESVNAAGAVGPRERISISARVTARIVELPHAEGDVVTRGDTDAATSTPPSVLVRLDATDLEAGLRSAEARRAAQAAQIEVEKARIAAQHAENDALDASLRKAEDNFHRLEVLLRSKDTSQSAYGDARSQYEELKARRQGAEHSLKAAETGLEVLKYNVQAAEAEIARARDALSYTTITAPLDGVVTKVNAKVGELVVTGTMNNPGTVIMEVADLSEMIVEADVDETDVPQVQPGQRAVVHIRAYPGEKFTGTVESIALTPTTRQDGAKSFKTRIRLEPTQHRLYTGLTADVDIQTKANSDVLKAPSQAVLGRPTDELPLAIRENNPNVDAKKAVATVVYRVIDDKAIVTPVTVGPSNDTHTVVRSGLAETDRIVVGPYKVLEGLKHEDKVRDERAVEKEKQQKVKPKVDTNAAPG